MNNLSKSMVLLTGMIFGGFTYAAQNQFTLVITVGGLDKSTQPPKVCIVDSTKQKALWTVFNDPYKVISESTKEELTEAFHVMPQIPSISVKVRFDAAADPAANFVSADDVTLFEDYESISYRPRTELLAIMRVAMRLCNIQYTAFNLPTKD